MSTELALGPLIRTLRTSAGLTQREAADRAGLSLGALRDLEQGRTGTPRPRSLRALAEALDADPDLLLSAAPALRPATARDRPVASTVGILGPLALRSAAGPIVVRGRAVRAVLGLLALHPNEYVHYDQFAESIWDGAHPPTGWRALLHSHLARARRLLQQADPTGRVRIASAPQRYRLDIDEAALDSTAFIAAVDRAMTTRDRIEAGQLYASAFGRWRGPVLADVDELNQHPRAARLAEIRTASAMAFAEAALAAEQPDRALPTMTALCQADPLNEGLIGKQLRLLAASGRLAEAGQLYRGTRTLLADELGVEPSEHLQATYVRLLNDRAEPDDGARGDADHLDRAWLPPQPPTPPRQLPRDLSDFVGRDAELAELLGYLSAGPAGAGRRHGQPPAAAILGMGGLGKTTLAVRVAHQVAEDYPSGQLFANLDVDGAPVPPATVLEHFLLAMGHPKDRLPTDLAQLAGLFRSMVADGRYLVVLDNVRNAEQVLPLLPGSASSAVLITSRGRLADLDGLRRLHLRPLSQAESLRMLESMIEHTGHGSDRDPAGQLDGAGAVSRLCGGLPLALRLAAARRITDPTTDLEQIADQLAGSGVRLDALRSPGRAVRHLLQASYHELPAAISRALPLVTLIPGSDFGLAAAARALDESPAAASYALDRLCDASLLLTAGPDRYQLHDIVRDYGHELALNIPAEQRLATHERILTWYVRTGALASRQVYPHRVSVDSRSVDLELPAGEPADTEAAVQWLEQEHANLVAAIAQAEDLRLPEYCWRLVDAAAGAFRLQPRSQDWQVAAKRGLATATRSQDWPAIAMMHESLARAHAAREDHTRAIAHYRAGLEAADRASWPQATVSLLENLAISLWVVGDLGAAELVLKRAIELSWQTGQRFFEGASLNDLGNIRLSQGYCRDAIGYYRSAMTINDEIGDSDGLMVNLSNIAETWLRLGELDEAKAICTSMLAGPVRRGDPTWLPCHLVLLSRIHRIEGSAFHASSLAEQALELLAGAEDAGTCSDALIADGLAKAGIGLTDFGRARVGEAVQVARRSGSPSVLLPALLASGELLREHDPARAHSVLTEALAVADELGDVLSQAEAQLSNARLSAGLGNHEVADQFARQAQERFVAAGHRLGAQATAEFLSSLPINTDLLEAR